MSGNLVITIGREFGSGGRKIGRMLAEALNIAYYDKELIEEASRRSGVSREFLEKADEKAPSLLDFALIGSYGNESVLSSGNFYVLQTNVILSLAGERPCVIVGRSADYVLRNHPNILNIFIHAPKNVRVDYVAKRESLAHDAAEELVEKCEKARAKYYNFYTDKTWGAASSYHISVDSSLLGFEGTAKVLKEFVDKVVESRSAKLCEAGI